MLPFIQTKRAKKLGFKSGGEVALFDKAQSHQTYLGFETVDDKPFSDFVLLVLNVTAVISTTFFHYGYYSYYAFSLQISPNTLRLFPSRNGT